MVFTVDWIGIVPFVDYNTQGISQPPDEKREWEGAPQQEVYLGVGVVVRQGTDVRGDVGGDQACIRGVEQRPTRTREMAPGREKRIMMFDVSGEGCVTTLRQEINIRGYGGPAACDCRWIVPLPFDLYLRLGD